MKRKAQYKDIKYTAAYNPEGINKKRDVLYIVDGDGKEKLLVEEINEDNKNERQ